MKLRSSVVAGAVALSVGLALAAPAAGAVTAAETSRAAAPPAAAVDETGAFSFAVVPDTQQEVFGKDDRIRQRMQWLADRKVAYVAHVGDLTNWGWLAASQLSRASDGMRPLEVAKIPYSISIGNHDTRAIGWNGKGGYGGGAYVQNPECKKRLGAAQCKTALLARRTDEINKTFPASRFGAVKGVFETGKIDNVYSTFSAGGLKWLVLNLELWPRQAALDWADGVLRSHPHHNVIVQTHSYLEGDGTISRSYGYGSHSPRHVWASLLSRHANVRFVLSGHVGQAAVRTDKGRAGNTVVSMLQTFHSNDTNPVRLVRVLPRANQVQTSITGPTNGRAFPAYTRTLSMSFVR